jgi:hypothetical protein
MSQNPHKEHEIARPNDSTITQRPTFLLLRVRAGRTEYGASAESSLVKANDHHFVGEVSCEDLGVYLCFDDA